MIHLTDRAVAKVKEARAKQAPSGAGLRIRVMGGGCAGLMFELAFDAPRGDDRIFEQDEVQVVMDPKSAILLEGSEIDYVEALTGSGFTLKNPRAQMTCSCGKSFAV